MTGKEDIEFSVQYKETREAEADSNMDTNKPAKPTSAKPTPAKPTCMQQKKDVKPALYKKRICSPIVPEQGSLVCEDTGLCKWNILILILKYFFTYRPTYRPILPIGLGQLRLPSIQLNQFPTNQLSKYLSRRIFLTKLAAKHIIELVGCNTNNVWNDIIILSHVIVAFWVILTVYFWEHAILFDYEYW